MEILGLIGAFLFKRYLKYTLIGILVLALGAGTCMAVRRHYQQKAVIEEYREVQKRVDKINEVLEKGRKVREKINRSRDVRPSDDGRDSCLLSSANPAKDCDKFL